jgi:hypothetical protein
LSKSQSRFGGAVAASFVIPAAPARPLKSPAVVAVPPGPPVTLIVPPVDAIR